MSSEPLETSTPIKTLVPAAFFFIKSHPSKFELAYTQFLRRFGFKMNDVRSGFRTVCKYQGAIDLQAVVSCKMHLTADGRLQCIIDRHSFLFQDTRGSSVPVENHNKCSCFPTYSKGFN